MLFTLLLGTKSSYHISQRLPEHLRAHVSVLSHPPPVRCVKELLTTTPAASAAKCRELSCSSRADWACWLRGRGMGRAKRKPGTDTGVQVGSKAGHLQTSSSIQGAGKVSQQHGISPCRAGRIRCSTRMLLLLRNKRCLALEGSRFSGNFQMLSYEKWSTK